MLENILIVGGTSGLGLELAKQYNALGHSIFITGRNDPKIPNLQFLHFSISHATKDVVSQIDTIVSKVGSINTLIYVAGYCQRGRIDTLNDEQILGMINIGLTAPSLFIQRLKNNAGSPLNIMLITSSSQYTAREFEPMYTATKAGLGMLGESLSLDSEIGKVLVIAPSGMKTPFWDKEYDTSGYLDATWVAKQVVKLSIGNFKYKFVKILRNPPQVEIVATR